MDPDFNSPSLFVLYIGVRQAITAVERGAWSDGSKALERRRCCNATEDSKGRHGVPLVNHAITIQGDKAQLTRCARRPCKSEIAKLLNMTSGLDRGPLTTPKSLPACRATAAPPK